MSNPSVLSQMLDTLLLSLFMANKSRLPESAQSEPRPHVREGLAPPSGAVNVHHWLRLAETRMSTGMRGAREGALPREGARALLLRFGVKEGGAGEPERTRGFLPRG